MKLKKSIRSIALLAGMVLVGQHAASADVTVVYKMASADGNGTQTIRYVDKQHVRLDMRSAGNKMSMLKLGDKVYSINGKVVQDMSQLAQMMAAMGVSKNGGHKASAPIKFTDTGRTESIAGIRGKVYRFEDNGRRHEVVLGQNGDLQAAMLGVVEITRAAVGMKPFGALDLVQHNASLKNMAVLRLDDRMRLQSIDTSAVAGDTFRLPAKPQQMGGMGELMKGALGR